MLDMKQRLVGAGSSGSLQSPESNETVERRHLKSILKKLSADEDAGDGDRLPKSGRRAFSLRRRGPIDLKRLMRAPTVEGYVARHTKLTKSVTFDRETLPSPTEPAAAEGKHDDGEILDPRTEPSDFQECDLVFQVRTPRTRSRRSPRNFPIRPRCRRRTRTGLEET